MQKLITTSTEKNQQTNNKPTTPQKKVKTLKQKPTKINPPS